MLTITIVQLLCWVNPINIICTEHRQLTLNTIIFCHTEVLCHVFPSSQTYTLLDFEIVGGVAHAEMLGRTNLVAVVGGGQAPKFPDRNGTIARS